MSIRRTKPAPSGRPAARAREGARVLLAAACLLTAPAACSEPAPAEDAPAEDAPRRAPEDAGHPTLAFQEETVAGAHPGYRKPYTFSEDWFSENLPVWEAVFAPFVGKPDLRYLEIGVYEGRSFFWMLENVLTHPSAHLTAIDIFIPEPLEKRFLDNVEASGQAERITTIKGYSGVELRKLPLDAYDIIYIDGSHAADDVLVDAALAWGMLKDGGILVFDDFQWDGSYYTGPESHLPVELVPKWAIWAFMNSHRNYFDVVHSGYQMVLRKRANPCPNKTTCSPLGRYRYDWETRTLHRGTETEPVALSDAERGVMEQILWNRALAEGGFVLHPPFGQEPAVRGLVERLQLEIALPEPTPATPAP